MGNMETILTVFGSAGLLTATGEAAGEVALEVAGVLPGVLPGVVTMGDLGL